MRTHAPKAPPSTGQRRHLYLTAGTVAMAALAAGTISSCAVGAQSSPQPLASRAVPYRLLGAGSPPSTFIPWVDVRVTIYLEGKDQHLQPVAREVASPATLSAVLAQLAAGTTEKESERGLLSPASMVGPLSVRSSRNGVVTVDLPDSFEDLDGRDQTVAAAQIVYTATAFRGVRGVIFRVAGQAAQVPDDNGHLTSGPSTRSDYSTLMG